MNNTITDNDAYYSGGGIYCRKSCSPTLTNTIFWNNSAPTGPECSVELYSSYPSTLTINYSDVKDGQASVYVDPGCTLNWGNGMIDDDPLFVDPTNDDFHLSFASPCINRGLNSGAPPEDIDGDVRPYMGTVDMGCDEFTGTHLLEADDFSIPAQQRSIVGLILNAGAAYGNRLYIMFGTVSGTTPGIPLPKNKGTLPIKWDWYTSIVLRLLNSPMFIDFVGFTDPSGVGNATYDTLVPPTDLAGLTISFAYALYGPWDQPSNPVSIEVVP